LKLAIKMRKKSLTIFIVSGLIISCSLLGIHYSLAANNGNSYGYAWSENSGWIRFDGTGSGVDYGVTVPDSSGAVTGYAWSENAGWIHMASSTSGACIQPADSCASGYAYNVNATSTCPVGSICLSGFAWGEGTGWIRFAATSSNYANNSTSTYGVYIDSNNDFQGYAWGEQVGWIHFVGSCQYGSCPTGSDHYGVSKSESGAPSPPSSATTTTGVAITATGGDIVIFNNKITVTSSSGDGHRGILAYGSGVSALISGNNITVSGNGTTRYGIEARYANITAIRNTINAADADIVAGVDGVIIASGQNRLEGSGYNFKVGSVSGLIKSSNDYYSTVYNIGTFSDLSFYRNSNEIALTVTQSGTGKILSLYDSAQELVSIDNSGATTFKPASFDYVYNFDGVGTYTDNTAEAKSSGGTGFTILAAENPSNDEFYLGLDHKFNTIYFGLATSSAGTTTLAAQYSTSTGWAELTVTDNTSNLTVDGTITFTAPADWTTTAVNGQTKYWIRLGSTGTEITTAPMAYSVSPTTGSRFSVFAQAGDTNPALHINDQGKIGIGTTTPGYLLTIDAGASSTYGIAVEGSIKASGSIDSNTGLDIAERYSIDSQCEIDNNCPEVGDLVSITENLVIEKSLIAYDSKLIGIAAENSAIKMGGGLNSSSSRLVALAGRVLTKVSTENGEIVLGDALTSASSTSGVAMKATRAGRIIGYALEPFSTEGEIGKIMVFVNPGWQGNNLTVITNENGEIVQSKLQQGLADIGLIVNEYGTLEVEKLKAKTARLEKIEMVDQVTGEIWCTWIENGEWIKVLGDCDNVSGTTEEQATPAIYYYDGDGDGYGNWANFVTDPSQEGYVANSDDCNDDDPAINPGAAEICGDGIDNNCNGLIDTADPDCSTTTDATTTDATTTDATSTEPVCTPNWSCSDWQPLPETIACGATSTQTRTCTDSNDCGIEEEKPIEEQQVVGTYLETATSTCPITEP